MKITNQIFKSIPLDPVMTQTIMVSLSVASHDQVIDTESRDASAVRIVRLLRVIFPDVVKEFDKFEWIKNA